MLHLDVDGAVLEYETSGEGEPVLLIALSVIADGLAAPLFRQPALSGYRLIHYRRRGYLGSTVATAPFTIADQAADALAVLRHLDVPRAHVVGHSYGGVIALQLAHDAPDVVHTLALLEPAMRVGPIGRAHLRTTVASARERYVAGDIRGFVTVFSDGVFGPGWTPIVEAAVPGAIDQAVADAATLFGIEQPALLEWEFGAIEAGRLRQPVLSMVGTRSAAIFHEGREFLHRWIPQVEDLDPNATHLLQMEDPVGVAKGLADFFARHPFTQN